MYVSSINPLQYSWNLQQGPQGIQSGAAGYPVAAFNIPAAKAIGYSFNPMQPGSMANPNMANSNWNWNNQITPYQQAFSAQQPIVSYPISMAQQDWNWTNNPNFTGMVSPVGINYIHSSFGFAQPHIELAETNYDVVVTCELPDINPNNLSLTVTDDSLSISGISMSGVNLYRVVALPTTIRSEQVDASYANGFLEVRLPKSDATARRRIKVNTIS